MTAECEDDRIQVDKPFCVQVKVPQLAGINARPRLALHVPLCRGVVLGVACSLQGDRAWLERRRVSTSADTVQLSVQFSPGYSLVQSSVWLKTSAASRLSGVRYSGSGCEV